jgi:NTE family protein
VAAQRELLGPDDVLLTPQFSDALTSMSFARISETIEIGYDVVMEQREELERFALDPASYDAYLASRRNPRVEALPILNFVRLDNDSIVADSVIRTRLRDIEIGEPLDIDVVERAMNKVYGLELYQNVRYNVVTENGETGLEIDLDTRTWGPNYLQLGVEYSSSGDEDTLFALAASYLRTTINELNGEWRATFVVGDEPALLADLYQPLGDSGLFFFAPALTFESRLFNVFDDEDLAAELKIREATLEVAAGRELEGWGEVRFGVRSTVGDNELRVGDPAFLPDPDFRRGEFFTKLSADTMDSVAFPRSGTLATAEWRGSREHPLSADVDFDQLLLSAAHAKTWGRHTMLSTFRYDATVSGEAPVSRLFRLGGFFDLSGLNQNQLSGQHAARIGASYYRRIGDLALFPAFAGISLELGNVWQSRSDMSFGDSILGGSFWAGVNTPVGPVYVGYGRAEGGADGFYVFLGRIF